MRLLDLAPELLDEIIGYCMPVGFESFALTCKGSYTYCRPQIALHNRLSKRWKYTTNQFPRQHDTLRLLLEIVKEPLVAQYIQHLDLWDYHRSYETDVPRLIPIVNNVYDPEADFRDDEATMLEIKDLIMHSSIPRYLALAGIDAEDWWMQFSVPRIPSGTTSRGRNASNDLPSKINQEYAFLALLFLLPNLRSLAPYYEWSDLNVYEEDSHQQHYVYPVLDALVEQSHKPHSIGQPLSNLATILPNYTGGSQARASLGPLQWFMQLPSVTALYGVSCLASSNNNRYGFYFSWRYLSIPNNLTRLELAYSDIDPDNISRLLSSTRQLQSFRFHYQWKGTGIRPPWSAQLFVEAVAECCGPTITELAVTLAVDDYIKHGVQSFLGFPKLEKLEIDLRILCGPSRESGRELVWSLAERRYRVPEGVCAWSQVELPCLASILPKSLECVHINIDGSRDGLDVMALLSDFTEERAALVPGLEKVLFRRWHVGLEKELVEAEGCEFEIVEPHSNPSRSSRRRPAFWMREFEVHADGVTSNYMIVPDRF